MRAADEEYEQRSSSLAASSSEAKTKAKPSKKKRDQEKKRRENEGDNSDEKKRGENEEDNSDACFEVVHSRDSSMVQLREPLLDAQRQPQDHETEEALAFSHGVTRPRDGITYTQAQPHPGIKSDLEINQAIFDQIEEKLANSAHRIMMLEVGLVSSVLVMLAMVICLKYLFVDKDSYNSAIKYQDLSSRIHDIDSRVANTVSKERYVVLNEKIKTQSKIQYDVHILTAQQRDLELKIKNIQTELLPASEVEQRIGSLQEMKDDIRFLKRSIMHVESRQASESDIASEQNKDSAVDDVMAVLSTGKFEKHENAISALQGDVLSMKESIRTFRGVLAVAQDSWSKYNKVSDLITSALDENMRHMNTTLGRSISTEAKLNANAISALGTSLRMYKASQKVKAAQLQDKNTYEMSVLKAKVSEETAIQKFAIAQIEFAARQMNETLKQALSKEAKERAKAISGLEENQRSAMSRQVDAVQKMNETLKQRVGALQDSFSLYKAAQNFEASKAHAVQTMEMSAVQKNLSGLKVLQMSSLTRLDSAVYRINETLMRSIAAVQLDFRQSKVLQAEELNRSSARVANMNASLSTSTSECKEIARTALHSAREAIFSMSHAIFVKPRNYKCPSGSRECTCWHWINPSEHEPYCADDEPDDADGRCWSDSDGWNRRNAMLCCCRDQ